MRRPLTNRERQIGWACLVTIAGCLYVQTFIAPSTRKNQTVREEIRARLKEWSVNQTALRRHRMFRDRYEALRRLQRPEGSDEERVSDILSAIEKEAAVIGVRVTNIKPEQPQRGEFFERFLVSLTVESGFDAVMEFLHTLQQKPYSLAVEELTLERGDLGRTEEQLTTRLVLAKTYAILGDGNPGADETRNK